MSSDQNDTYAGIAKPTELFLGDRGELELDTRRALVQLLTGPSLEEERHPNLWPVLLNNEAVIRARLADLFLDLVVDLDTRVAFIRQADCGDLEVLKLLRRAPLTFLDSVLLLFLRQQLTRSQNQGERAAVSAKDLLEHLSLFESSGNTDKAGFAKRSKAAIEKMKNHSVLRKIRNSDDRFEISPTLKLILSAEETKALVEAYKKIKHEGELPESADQVSEDGPNEDSEADND